MIQSLQALANNRDALLLAEVAAWLHDVGKFCVLHIEAHSGGGSRKWSNDHAYKAVIDKPDTVIRLNKAAASVKKPDALNNVLNAQSPKAADFLPQDAKDFLAQTVVRLPDQQYSLAEVIMLGTPGFATDKNRAQLLDGKDGWLPAALGVCHNEAHHDKQEPASGQGAQKWPKVFISTAFGYEEKVVDVEATSSDNLDLRLKRLPWRSLLSSRQKLLEEFSFGLGDTRRPINEVTLADWASTVASLYKPALATYLLQSQPPAISQWKSWKDKLIDHDLRWRLLRVNFDVLGLYAKAVKIADLVGYQDAVKKACAAVKQLVEEEYPLGNEIYRDTSGIYFTFPDIDLPADLAQEIRRRVDAIEPELAPYIAVEKPSGNTATEQLKNMLAGGRQKALGDLAQPFSQDNLSPCWRELWGNLPKDGKWELCPVCRLRPMKEGEEACETCTKRRQSRIEWWQKNPQQTIWMDEKTIWMDEIADHNDRVALLIGKFGLEDWLSGDLVQTMLVRAVENKPDECRPKNPSPARLRRVWETCQRFWTETVNGILQKHSYGEGNALRRVCVAVVPDDTSGWKENVPYDGTINGKAVSLLWQEDKKRFITISNLQLGVSQAQDETALVGEWHSKTCTIGLPDRPGKQRTFMVQQVMLLSGDPLYTYAPYLTLLESPDQFLALVPAADALEIAQKIEQEYRRQMGKVQNRLPLFLGLVFFQRKTPLMAVMDTARRMLEQVNLGEEDWEVECVCPEQDGQTCYLRFSRGHQRLEFNVPLKMGDNRTDDSWYPYFFVKEFFDHTPDNHVRRFQLNGRWLVHARDLKPGDTVTLIPSRFAYLFLESTAQRFRFDPQREALLLDDLKRLRDLWQAICTAPEMTDSKLQAIAALFEQKRQEWDLPFPAPQNPITDETFRHLVETTLKRDNVNIRAEEVLNGHFQRAVDLHLHILKRRVKDYQKEAQDDQPNA